MRTSETLSNINELVFSSLRCVARRFPRPPYFPFVVNDKKRESERNQNEQLCVFCLVHKRKENPSGGSKKAVSSGESERVEGKKKNGKKNINL